MKKIILNTLSWIFIVSVLSFYLEKTFSFPLINYILILGVSLVVFGIISILKPIFKTSNIKNALENTINFRNIEGSSISICLAGIISLLTCILL
ncbi:hypothetical protein [Clostridium sp. D46t1_190503_E9]|uniref:hypothetical protein n=1 Tax=Clostridium sp. D46t1_190503_E9 TaxID=2787137 RepID=UPI00189862BD|nr:hypothetical protein [Clostridium sp. D46t1_190503_E9]